MITLRFALYGLTLGGRQPLYLFTRGGAVRREI